ncbi:unnamed protein product [Cunninghamella echinulata]
MIGIKTLTMIIGLFMIMIMMITTTDALDKRRTSLKRTTPFAVRRGMAEDASRCNLTCNDNNSCQNRCGGSGVDKILLSVCYEGQCYCGFMP